MAVALEIALGGRQMNENAIFEESSPVIQSASAGRALPAASIASQPEAS
jgi:hypothetical protein